MRTLGFLRLSRRVAPGITVGAVSYGSFPTAIFVALALVAGVLIGCAIGGAA